MTCESHLQTMLQSSVFVCRHTVTYIHYGWRQPETAEPERCSLHSKLKTLAMPEPNQIPDLLKQNRCKIVHVHNCDKLSVMIDHRIALNLLAVQIVQWKIVRQKAANICCSKRLEKV